MVGGFARHGGVGLRCAFVAVVGVRDLRRGVLVANVSWGQSLLTRSIRGERKEVRVHFFSFFLLRNILMTKQIKEKVKSIIYVFS